MISGNYYTTFTDNGTGKLVLDGRVLPNSSINYGSGAFTIAKSDLAQNCVTATYDVHQIDKGASYVNVATGQKAATGLIVTADEQATATVMRSAATVAYNETINTGQYTFNVLDGKPWPRMAVLNSWIFDVGGVLTYERAGTLYQQVDPRTGNGAVVGRMDAISGEVTITAAMGTGSIKVLAGVYTTGEFKIKQYYGRTPAAPIKPQSYTVYAEAGSGIKSGTAQADESISGDISGSIDTETGFFAIDANEQISPESLRYNVVTQSYIPLDSSIIGIDAVRLPPDGRVPIYRKGDMIVIGNRQKHGLGSAHTAGQAVSLGRTDIDRAAVVDAKAVPVDAAKYTVNLKDGTLTWADPLDLSAYTLPLTAHTAQEEENRIVGVDISGSLKLQFPVSRAYPQDGTYVSSALIGGDLLVRATEPFSMQAWDKKWLDEPSTDPILAKLNVKDYPIKLISAGAITERWLIVFDSDSQYKLYGETLGLVAQGDTLNDLAPPNPATNKPYFTLPKFAFGGGWGAGNCVRFNTFGTPLPVWILRAVQPSATAQSGKDGFTGCLRGNTIDA